MSVELDASIAPALTGVRLTLHVLAAAVWVGGQLTLAGLVGTARRLGPEAPRSLARAFARISWPAYFVLLATGAWNVAATSAGQSSGWLALLAAKILVVLLAGLSAWLHARSRTPKGLAIWGGMTGLSSIAALAMGVFLAG